MPKTKIKETGRKIPDIILFDNLKALKEAEKEALFFTLDKNLCDKARERGFICRSPADYIDSKDLEFKNPDYELMYEYLSKLATYDDINLGLLMQNIFIHLEASQKFRVYKILKELFDKENPNSIKVVTKGKPIYSWNEVGDTEIPVNLVESMADNKGIDFKVENMSLTTPIKNKLFKLTSPFLLRNIERFTESVIRIRRGNVSKGANADIIIFTSTIYLDTIEPVLKYLSKRGIKLLIIMQSHGFFNFGLSKAKYKYLQDLGAVRSFESYQNKAVYKIVKREQKRLKKIWNEIRNDGEFQKQFFIDNANVWNAFKDHFWFYYSVQFPRLVKYIETGKRILEIEEPEAVVFKADGPVPDRTFSIVAEKFQIPTILISHGICFPTKNYIPTSKYVAVWGPKFKDYMILKGLDAQQVAVTGAPNYDALTKLESKEDLRRELGLPESKLIVTFATQGFSEQIRRKLTYEVLKSMKELNGVLLVIKPHPLENPKIYRKFLREFDADIPPEKIILMPKVNTSKLIKASDLLLTVNSTVALEANVIGTPVLTLNFTEQKDVFYSGEGGAVGVENPEALTDMIYKALYDEKFKEEMSINRNEFLQKYIAYKDGGATEKAADLVLRVMEESRKERNEN